MKNRLAPKPPVQIAPRKHNFEALFCQAIAAKVLVTLNYKFEGVTRTFQPSAVYPSEVARFV